MCHTLRLRLAACRASIPISIQALLSSGIPDLTSSQAASALRLQPSQQGIPPPLNQDTETHTLLYVWQVPFGKTFVHTGQYMGLPIISTSPPRHGQLHCSLVYTCNNCLILCFCPYPAARPASEKREKRRHQKRERREDTQYRIPDAMPGRERNEPFAAPRPDLAKYKKRGKGSVTDCRGC